MHNSFDNLNSNNNFHFEQNNSSSDLFAFQQKVFFDGYEIVTPVKMTKQSLAEFGDPFGGNSFGIDALQENKTQQINQALYKEALKEITQRLLLEIIFLAATYRYYQQFAGTTLNLNDCNTYPENSYQYNPQHHIYKDVKRSPHHFVPSYPVYKERIYNSWPKHLYTWLANDTKALASVGGNSLINEARHDLGKPVWAFTKFASLCQSGYLGCAATVSDLLQHSGVKIAGSASVAGVVSQLSDLGWHKIKISDKHQFQRGDIVFGLNGSHGHIGIISAADKDEVLVCDNSSSSGTLKERTIECGGSFTPNGRFAGHLYVMRQERTNPS